MTVVKPNVETLFENGTLRIRDGSGRWVHLNKAEATAVLDYILENSYYDGAGLPAVKVPPVKVLPGAETYSHYHKTLPEGLAAIDVYGVLHLFEVQYQEIGHAIKKLLAPGDRGGKAFLQDVKEARDTLNCFLAQVEIFNLGERRKHKPVDFSGKN